MFESFLSYMYTGSCCNALAYMLAIVELCNTVHVAASFACAWHERYTH